MRLYEITLTSLWWIAAEDEMEAINILRDELYNIEVPEEEMDVILDELRVEEVGSLSAPEDVWIMFSAAHEPGLIHTDFYREDEFEDEIDYNVEGSLPEDWM